mgnify:CR=1 FL=1
MGIIHPSPAIIVRADTPIADCIEKMITANCGSVLVMRDSHPGDLVGIFTERDLLKKIPEIRKQNAWEKSVALVMTSQVHTITTPLIRDAADIMLKGNFRHLPVVDKPKSGPEAGKIRILGVISIRDVLRQVIQHHLDLLSPAKETRAILCSLLPGFAKSLIRTAKDVLNVEINRFALEKMLDDEGKLSTLFTDFDVVIIDIDHRRDTLWLEVLKQSNRQKAPPPLFLTYDPSLHPERTLRGLQKIALAQNFHVFPKPVNLLAMAAQIASYSRE